MGRPKKIHDEHGRPLYTEAGNKLEYWDNEEYPQNSAVHILDPDTGERLGTYNYTFDHTFPARDYDEYDIAAEKGLHYQAVIKDGKRTIDGMIRFAPIPHNLFLVTKYNKLSNNAKLLYGLMHSRMMLSFQNEKMIDDRPAWWDVYGRIKFYYSRQTACDMLNITEPVAIKIFKELVSHGLLYEKTNDGYNKPKTLWLLKPLTSEQYLADLQSQIDSLHEWCIDRETGELLSDYAKENEAKYKRLMEIEVEAIAKRTKIKDD